MCAHVCVVVESHRTFKVRAVVLFAVRISLARATLLGRQSGIPGWACECACVRVHESLVFLALNGVRRIQRLQNPDATTNGGIGEGYDVMHTHTKKTVLQNIMEQFHRMQHIVNVQLLLKISSVFL